MYTGTPAVVHRSAMSSVVLDFRSRGTPGHLRLVVVEHLLVADRTGVRAAGASRRFDHLGLQSLAMVSASLSAPLRVAG
jgi:hypothetical protein